MYDVQVHMYMHELLLSIFSTEVRGTTSYVYVHKYTVKVLLYSIVLYVALHSAV